MIPYFQNDFHKTLFQAFHDLYPAIEVEVWWATDEEIGGAKGICNWTKDGPIIGINLEIPAFNTVDILCHELAHAATCKDCPGDGQDEGDHHCPEWEAAYEAIYRRYCEITLETGKSKMVQIIQEDRDKV